MVPVGAFATPVALLGCALTGPLARFAFSFSTPEDGCSSTLTGRDASAILALPWAVTAWAARVALFLDRFARGGAGCASSVIGLPPASARWFLSGSIPSPGLAAT